MTFLGVGRGEVGGGGGGGAGRGVRGINVSDGMMFGSVSAFQG